MRKRHRRAKNAGFFTAQATLPQEVCLFVRLPGCETACITTAEDLFAFVNETYYAECQFAHALTNNFPPEDDMGNCEYKRQFPLFTVHKFQKRKAQIEHRLREGHGRAFYVIGVDDDGTANGICAQDMCYTVHCLMKIIETVQVNITLTSVHRGASGNIMEFDITQREGDPRIFESHAIDHLQADETIFDSLMTECVREEAKMTVQDASAECALPASDKSTAYSETAHDGGAAGAILSQWGSAHDLTDLFEHPWHSDESAATRVSIYAERKIQAGGQYDGKDEEEEENACKKESEESDDGLPLSCTLFA